MQKARAVRKDYARSATQRRGERAMRAMICYESNDDAAFEIYAARAIRVEAAHGAASGCRASAFVIAAATPSPYADANIDDISFSAFTPLPLSPLLLASADCCAR